MDNFMGNSTAPSSAVSHVEPKWPCLYIVTSISHWMCDALESYALGQSGLYN